MQQIQAHPTAERVAEVMADWFGKPRRRIYAQLIAALETAEYDLANGGYDKRNTLTTIRAALAAAKEAQ